MKYIEQSTTTTHQKLQGMDILENMTRSMVWLLLLLLSFSALAGDENDEVLGGLLAGRDVASQVAALPASAPAKRGKVHDELALDFERELRALTALGQRAIAAPERLKDDDQLQQLRARLEALNGQRYLMAARFQEVEARVEAAGLGPVIRERAEAAGTTFRAFAELLDQLSIHLNDDAAGKTARADAVYGILLELDDLSLEVVDPAPILRAAQLPFHRPRHTPAPLVTEPAITPSYLQQAPEPGTSLQLNPSVGVPLSPTILAKAAELEYDYLRIFDFVHGAVRTEYYAGAMKGAEAVLRSRAGNDVDQASLLIALFRASGLPSRYVHGVIELPVAQVGAPLGLSDAAQISDALGRAGVAHEPVIRGGRIDAFRLAHTWVSAFVPYTNYRGSVVDFSGKAWMPLDPSVKDHGFLPGRGVVEAMALDADDFVDSFLRGERETSPVNTLRAQVEAWLVADSERGSYDEQFARITVDAPSLGLLPSGLSYPVIAVLAEQVELDESRLHELRFLVSGEGDEPVMEVSLPVVDLMEHRITFSYVAATVDDHNTLRQFNGIGTTPAYLVRLRPQINVDGKAVAGGQTGLPMGESHALTLELSGPFGSRSTTVSLVTGSYAAIALGGQLGMPEPVDEEVELLDDNESRAARLMHNHAVRYTAEWDRAETELAGLFDVAVVRPMPSLAAVISSFETSYNLGLPVDLEFEGVSLDAAMRAAEPFTRSENSDLERGFMRLAGLAGSYPEAELFGEQWAVESISADKGFQLAVAAGQQLYSLDADNLEATLPSLSHEPHVLDQIRALVGAGYQVSIPEATVALNAWSGSVWHAWDEHGASGYFISGGWAGGSTTEEPEAWLLDELASLLGNPYGEEPNDDPLAAFRIRRLPGSDNQFGTVGEPLERPLAVLVTDLRGRPVSGASVTFSQLTGNGTFDGGGATATVVTDDGGVAQAAYNLGRKTGDYPIFVKLNPGDEHANQVGEAWITAKVEGLTGTIELALPFSAYALPGEPTQLTYHGDAIELGYERSYVGPLSVTLEDIEGNPVANVPITYSAGTPLTDIECDPMTPAQFGATFFKIGDCQPDFFPGANNCGGESTLEINSTIYGATVGAVMGSHSSWYYPVTISAPGAASVNVNLAPLGGCGWAGIYGRHSYYVTPYGDILDAASPGDVLPLPRRYTVFWLDGNQSDPGYNSYYQLESASANFETLDGGGSTAGTALGTSIWEFQLPVGFGAAERGTHYVAENGVLTFPNGTRDDLSLSTNGEPVYAVVPSITAVNPTPVELDLYGFSKTPIKVDYQVNPPEYKPLLEVNLLEDGEVIESRFRAQGPYTGQVDFAPGRPFDLERTYEVELIVNPDTDWEIKSERFPVSLTQPIFSAVANSQPVHFSVNSPMGGGQVSGNKILSTLRFSSEYDIPNSLLCEITGVSFETTQDATISLEVHRLDMDGNPDAGGTTVIDGVDYPAGSHSLSMPIRDLGSGTFELTFSGVSAIDGHSDEVKAKSIITVINRNNLPLGHPVSHGIDLSDGSLTLSREDFAIPGLGGGLAFRRTYSSGTRTDISVIGAGWSHNYMSRILVNHCGQYTITGANGGGTRFIDGGDEGFQLLKGYHGSVVQEGDGFAYYTVNGTRHYYARKQERAWWLETIEDPNGNTTTLFYDDDIIAPKLTHIIGPAGRRIEFTYEHRNFLQWQGDVIVSLAGPGGITVNYSYDDEGNLTQAAREASAFSEQYDYLVTTDPQLRHLLAGYRDLVGGGSRSYIWQQKEFNVELSDEPFILDLDVISTVTEPDGSSISFTFDGQNTTGGFTSATVAGPTTWTYTMNDYGAATSMSGPNGTTTTSWDLENVVMSSRTDVNGNTTEFSYDEDGNLLSESRGGDSRNYTYTSAGFIKNLMTSATDWNGVLTSFSHDGAGNITSQDKGGVTLSYSYDGAGNMLSATNGNGFTSNFTYNGYGYRTSKTDPQGNRTSFVWDIRGRMLGRTDANNESTSFDYDSKDRLTGINYPDGSSRRTIFSDSAHTRTEYDGRNKVTVYSHDIVDRLTGVTNPMGASSSTSYDSNGWPSSSSDWNGNSTTYNYDGAGRMVSKGEPEGRSSSYTYDNMGNVRSMTVGSRTNTFRYDATRYFPTGETISGQANWNRTHDAMGNILTETDPLNRTTTYTYDDLYRMTSMSAPEGYVMSWTYDGAGNVTSETVQNEGGTQIRRFRYDKANRLVERTDADGAVWSAEYDGNGNITKVIDPRGKATIRTYDPMNRLLTWTDAAGEVTSFTYDGNGNVLTVNEPNGNVTTYTYDDLNRRLSASDSQGALETYTYDDNGNLLTVTDALGYTTVHTYDGLNRRTSTTLPGSRTYSFTYNIFGERLSETDPLGNTLVFSFDSLGHHRTTTGPEGLDESFTYDLVGNMLTRTDSMGHTTTYQYDGLDRQTQQSDQLYTRTTTYDKVGNKLTYSDARGIVTRWQYDLANRITHVYRAGQLIEQRDYDQAGNLIFLTDANGNQIGYEYDNRNQVIAENRPELAVTSYVRNAVGDVTEERLPAGRLIKRTYDLRRRLLTMTNGENETVTYTYDLNGNMATTSKPVGTWTYGYDEGNRIASVKDPLGHETSFTYDGAGNLKTQTLAEPGRVTSFDYDGRNRVEARNLPDGSRETYTYDANGNLTERVEPNGFVASFSHDALNREVTADFTDGVDTISVALTFDGNNNMTHIAETNSRGGGGTNQRVYDDFDRLTSVTDRFGNRQQYTYDLNGNRTRMLDHQGKQTAYGYDGLNRLTSVSLPDIGETVFSYTPNSLVSGVDYASGGTVRYQHDLANRLTAVVNQQNGELLSRFDYTYDDNGNRVRMEEENGAPLEVTTYDYDDADRLTQVNYPERTVAYTHDGVGNRLTETTTEGGTSSTKTYSYNNRDWLTSVEDSDNGVNITYDYDANGNMVEKNDSGQITRFAYTPRNRMRQVDLPSGSSAGYTYNSFGMRKSKDVDGAVTRYVYDDESLIAETNVLGNTLARYHYGSRHRIAEVRGVDGTYFFHDALGSTVATTGLDGTVRSRTSYDAWGKVTRQVGPDQTFGFTGYVADAETGLLYAQQRYYDPETARFTREDPFKGELNTPPSLHRYLYAFGNPTIFGDPDGREAFLTDVSKAMSEGARIAEDDFQREIDASDGGFWSDLTLDAKAKWVGFRIGALKTVGGIADTANFVTNTFIVTFELGEKETQYAAQDQLDKSFKNIEDTVSHVVENPGDVAVSLGKSAVDFVAKQMLAAVTLDPKLEMEASADRTELLFAVVGPTKGRLLTPKGKPGRGKGHGDAQAKADLDTDAPTVKKDLDRTPDRDVGTKPKDADVDRPDPKAVTRDQDANIKAPAKPEKATPHHTEFFNRRDKAYQRHVERSNRAGRKPEGKRQWNNEYKRKYNALKPSLDKRPLFLYQKLGPRGEHLKFGVAINPWSRYNQKQLQGGMLRILGSGERKAILAKERMLHRELPLGPEEAQKAYQRLQDKMGMQGPPSPFPPTGLDLSLNIKDLINLD